MIRELALFLLLAAGAMAALVALAEWVAPSPPTLLIEAQARAVPAPMCPVGPVARQADSRRIA
jgi:hypothetical protein